jgi:hypothetical protein
MTIRDTLTRYLMRDQVAALNQAIKVMESAYRRGPYQLSEEQLVQQLMETDNYLIDYVMRQRNYQLLSSAVTEFTEEDRLRTVDEARHMYHHDANTYRAVNMWTDFGFGQSVEVVPRDEALAEVWNEFWTARRNAPILKQRHIHQLSNAVVNDGELFLVFFGSSVDGKTTIRRLDTKSIIRIVCEKDDPDVPVYYVRQTTGMKEVWYPDWRATKEQQARIKLPQNAELADAAVPTVTVDGKQAKVTSVRVLHVAYDMESGRGWPVLARSYAWSRTLRNFLGDRAAVSRRAAMFVDEVIHKGGSRAQAAMEAKFASALNATTWGTDTNPPPAAGSTLIHDQAVDVKRRPLDTGAGDAEADGQMLAGQVSVGHGIPLHWMGWPQALANRATAREMARPWNEQLERYQLMWSDVFSDMVEIVGSNAKDFKSYEADVSLQSPLDVEVEEITAGMAALTGAVGVGAIDASLAVTANNKLAEQLLLTLGVSGALEGLEDEQREAQLQEAILGALSDAVRAGELSPEQAEGVLTGSGLLRRELTSIVMGDNGK